MHVDDAVEDGKDLLAGVDVPAKRLVGPAQLDDGRRERREIRPRPGALAAECRSIIVLHGEVSFQLRQWNDAAPDVMLSAEPHREALKVDSMHYGYGQL